MKSRFATCCAIIARHTMPSCGCGSLLALPPIPGAIGEMWRKIRRTWMAGYEAENCPDREKPAHRRISLARPDYRLVAAGPGADLGHFRTVVAERCRLRDRHTRL